MQKHIQNTHKICTECAECTKKYATTIWNTQNDVIMMTSVYSVYSSYVCATPLLTRMCWTWRMCVGFECVVRKGGCGERPGGAYVLR
jgi:hypothetical protein